MKFAKKNLLALAVSASTAAVSIPAYALIESYELRVSTNVENGEWLGLPVTYTEWLNTGMHYDCQLWDPAPALVDYGQTFLQTRLCNQDQQREAIVTEEHTGSGEVEEVSRTTQYQTILEEESQIATGERRDWQAFDSTFTQWVDISEAHSFESWEPSALGQIMDYTQSRLYLVDQERFEQKRERDAVTEDVREVGDPIRHVQQDSRTDTRDINVSASAWTNAASKVCGAWSPAPLTVDFGEAFEQSRTCNQDLERSWVHTLDNGEVVHTRIEDRVNTFGEAQNAVGERRDWQTISSTFTDWSNVGARKNFGLWSPAVEQQLENFVQTRSYDQDQSRLEQQREQDLVTGDIRNVGEPISHAQTVSGSESRTVDVTVGSWTDAGALYGCAAWSPALDSVNFGETFTQTRECSQDQSRSRIYKSGTTTVDNQTDARTVSESESQVATGTLRNWMPMESSYTSWDNDGARYDYGAWTPAPSEQTANFTQTRVYSQDQDRYEQKRERDLITGDVRNVGDPILREQTVSGNESRNVSVNWSSWTDSGARYDCSAWTPANDTVDFGEAYIQSRVCSQDQSRDRTYSTGSSTLHTAQESRTVNETETQAATGSGRDWQPTSSTYTAWINDGTPYGHTAWTPAAQDQTAGFTQTRSFSQDQDRYEQKREQDTVTGDIRPVGTPILRERTVSGDDSRNITVSWTNWTDSGTHYACGTWSPEPGTVNFGEAFTQTRDCSQDQTRNRVYKNGLTTVNTVAETRTVTETETQAATGSKRNWEPTSSTYTAWTNDGARYNYGTWSPVASAQTSAFSQSRTYSQDQDRYEQKRERDTVTGDIRPVGTPVLREQTISGNETREVAVTWSTWTDSGAHHSCGAWGPSTDTVNFGESFTQTRSCSQDQGRDRVYKVGIETINAQPETRTVSENETRVATGTFQNWQPTSSTYTNWNTTSNHTYGAWTPATGTQTADFTQTRSYKQSQERYEQRREQDVITGDVRDVGDPIRRTQTLDKSENRTISVSRSAWVDSGVPTNCSAWTPDRSTVPYGDAMTQTRDCDQSQTRTRFYKDGTTTLDTASETQTITVTQSNPTTGTARDWQPMTSSASSWTNVGDPVVSSWSPAVGSQTADFDQTRTTDQDQTRTVQQREYDANTGETRNVGDPVTQNRTIQNTDTRTVAVTYSTWTSSGSPYSCGAWTPATNQVRDGQEFEQTRNCSTNESRTRYYTADSTALGTVTETRADRPLTETQTATGTNQPPVANWSASRATTDTRYSTTFYLNNSDDGMIDRYVIDYGDGTSGTSTTHKYAPGSYQAVMTVWDDVNQSTVSQPISINVTQFDAAPTLTINHDYPNTFSTIHNAGIFGAGTRSFSYTASDDFGIASYEGEWLHTTAGGASVISRLGTVSGSGAFTNKSFSKYISTPGDYFFNFSVTDTKGTSISKDIYFGVRSGKNCQYNRSTGYYAQATSRTATPTYYWNNTQVNDNATYDYGKGAEMASESGSKSTTYYYQVCRYNAVN